MKWLVIKSEAKKTHLSSELMCLRSNHFYTIIVSEHLPPHATLSPHPTPFSMFFNTNPFSSQLSKLQIKKRPIGAVCSKLDLCISFECSAILWRLKTFKWESCEATDVPGSESSALWIRKRSGKRCTKLNNAQMWRSRNDHEMHHKRQQEVHTK